MTDLGVGFEATATEALLQQAEARLERRAEQIVREATRDALVRAGYDADALLDALVGPEVRREGQTVTVAWTIDHDAAGYLEFGTSEHTIEGDPLAFEWPDAPAEVRRQFADTFPTVFYTEVTVDGVAETRHTRKALRALARDL